MMSRSQDSPGSRILNHSRQSPNTPAHKRKISEVDEPERYEDVEASQRTQLLSDTEDETETEASRQQNSTATTDPSYLTAGTSFNATQVDSQPAHVPQFELPQDEMSQRTLDNLHAVPMPQNTSQLPPALPSLPNNFSAGSVGLSAFLNLEEQFPSSQVSDTPATKTAANAAMLATPVATQERITRSAVITPQTSPPNSGTRFSAQQAADLKTRLQLAKYKVDTNQSRTPFTHLKAPVSFSPSQRREGSSSPLVVVHSSSVHHSNPYESRSVQQTRYSSTDDTVSAMRARATAQPRSTVNSLSSIPAPIIKPTAYSARYADEDLQRSVSKPASTSGNESGGDKQFPSSPPLSRNSSSGDTVNLEGAGQVLLAQKALAGVAAAKAGMIASGGGSDRGSAHLSSPPNSDRGLDDDRGSDAIEGLIQLATTRA